MTEQSTISKLQKKEIFGRNVITLLLIGAAIATGLYCWGYIVPFLVDAATNTLKLVGLCAALAGIGYVAFDGRMRTLLSYGYRSLTRWITGQFVEIDPIGILNTYVERLTERLEEMDKSIGNLQGQRDRLKDTIEKNESNRVHNLQLAQAAQKKGGDLRQEFTLRARQAGRLEKSNVTLQNLLVRMEVLLKAMKKMREASALMCEDIKGEVEVKTAERKALMAGYNAFTNAKRIMEGGGAERELFDLTMEKLTDDYANKMGEIENFLDMSKSFINGMDLDNMVFEEDALKQLKDWEERGSKLLDTPGPKTNGVRIGEPVGAIRVDGTIEEESPTSFSDLFNSHK